MTMTIAAENGFEVGESYRVKKGVNKEYYKGGMIVKFVCDNNSIVPLFKIIQGEAERKLMDNKVYIDIYDLEPISIDNTSDKPKAVIMSLQTYIKHQYPNDVVLNTLVNTIWLINKGEYK